MKIAAVSDLHGSLPSIPECDLLLIAGDICPDFIARAPQRAWFVDKFLPWVKSQPCKQWYGTYGNHDWLSRPSVEWSELLDTHSIKVDEGVEYEGLKLWFTPWSNQFGHWAWMDQPYNLANKYNQIPEGLDILVSHQPALGYGDTPDPRYYMGDGDDNVGSRELREAITTKRPKTLICGHIHGGYGTYQHLDTTIYNVAQMNEAYEPVNSVTVFEI